MASGAPPAPRDRHQPAPGAPEPPEVGAATQAGAPTLTCSGLTDAGARRMPAPPPPAPPPPPPPPPAPRRHALLEQSFERDAALSLRPVAPAQRDSSSKWRRTASIKSAIKQASLVGRPERRADTGFQADRDRDRDRESLGGGFGARLKQFQPPVSERALQRNKRRGAMSNDPRRQLSADVLGIRQLTNEYLQNAGVGPGGGGLVSLDPVGPPTPPPPPLPPPPSYFEAGAPPAPAGPALPVMSPSAANSIITATADHQQHPQSQNLLHDKLMMPAAPVALDQIDGSQSPLVQTAGAGGGGGLVQTHPGHMPWQSDVSVQCELVQAPRLHADSSTVHQADGEPPYETTGDLLRTLAGPYPRLQLAQFHSTSSFDSSTSGHHHQLSASLKRGLSVLSAVNQHHSHHLSPSAGAAIQVVGSIKKSISSTLDIGRMATGGCLHSQDSLPAYSSLRNEEEEEEDDDDDAAISEPKKSTNNRNNNNLSNKSSSPALNCQPNDTQAVDNSLLGQLTSKLVRQSSCKLSVGKRGLQRALSFDCRGYKRLDKQEQQQQQQQQFQKHLTVPTSAAKDATPLEANNKKHRMQNKSLLSLDSSGRRPYLEQTASKVDFQLPLLPYHKMQEAIVAQRLIGPPQQQQQQQQQHQKEPQLQHQLAAEGGGNKVALTQMPANADELICAKAPDTLESPLIPEMSDSGSARQQSSKQLASSSDTGTSFTSSPKLTQTTRQTLGIPIIADETRQQQQQHQLIQCHGGNHGEAATRHQDGRANAGPHRAARSAEAELGPGAEEAGPVEQTQASLASTGVIVCLPSPSVVPDKTFEMFAATGSQQQQSAQVAAHATQGAPQSSNTLMLAPLRNRRPAIVPPKLVTDSDSPTGDHSQVATSQLIDLDDEQQQQQQCQPETDTRHSRRRHEQACLSNNDEADSSQHQHQHRTGGGAAPVPRPRHLAVRRRSISEHQISGLPTFYIEPNESLSGEPAHSEEQQSLPGQQQPAAAHRRPDSQMTQADSIISSGSSGNLSNLGRCKDFSLASPCSSSLKVNFGPAINRRRSSIAVIPQMQICPGDLLVYSKQLIDRMNQPPEEQDRPRFLPIDDKKAKNIWSSFKLFDNRTVRAREELLNSLEDVLASLQPSTFVDEQLSHYKGMAWNEFLYETESRRSASSERDILCLERGRVREKASLEVGAGGEQQSNLDTLTKLGRALPAAPNREPLKATLSSSATAPNSERQPPVNHEHATSNGPPQPTTKPKLRDKPKLRRGQTVDSVFRIPLIPSSPLKHAQQHQQTPTAHLEEHVELMTIDDNESATSCLATSNNQSHRTTRSSVKRNKSSSSSSRVAGASSRPRSSNAPPHAAAAAGHMMLLDKHHTELPVGGANGREEMLEEDLASSNRRQQQPENSSFETDDALDIILHTSSIDLQHGAPAQAQTAMNRDSRHQLARQSSLSTLSSIITRTEQKRQRALWDLFQSECTFFFDHLLTLKNVYMEPLKKIQVEGFAMFADPDTLFGNLDELCCGVYDFCKEFLLIIMRTLKTRPEELNATDVLIKLYKRNPKIDHLRGVYHRYTLNYINALTYLESLRKQVEFVEFEKWSSRDVRCKKLQLTDLLVAPVQHIMRVPIILKDIESHTENSKDRDEIRAILAVEEASLRELDDKMRWLKNFERLLEIQKSISWPSVLELDPKIFVPESLKENLAKQPCERLIVSPRRQIIYEGTLSSLDTGKPCDMHVILFDDMLLLTRRKKCLTKRTSNVCKTNSGGSATKDEALVKYMVYKQPLSLDRFYVQDVQPMDAQSSGYKHMFLLIVTNRYQQIVGLHSFMAANEDIKQTWLFKIKKTSVRWKRNFSNEQQNGQQQLKDIHNPALHADGETSKPDTNSHDQIYRPKVVDLEQAMRQPITLEQPQSIRSQNLALGMRTNVSAASSPKLRDSPGETVAKNNDMNNNIEHNSDMELVVMSTEDDKESSNYPTCNVIYTASAH